MNTRKASAGKWLTQATLEQEDSRTFATEVCGYGNLAELFTEWTDEQKQEWEQAHPAELPEVELNAN